jgi:hypothetical protein
MALACHIQCRKFRISGVFLETAHALLDSGVDFKDGVFADCFESLEIGGFCKFLFWANADDSFFGTGILNNLYFTYYSMSFPLLRS